MSFLARHTIDLNIALGMTNMSFKSFTDSHVRKSRVLITSRDHQPQGILKIGGTVFLNAKS